MRTSTGVMSVSAAMISIHAPRERCELKVYEIVIINKRFQSTHRVSDANLQIIPRRSGGPISIHAPRERCEPQIRNSMTFTCFLFQFYDKQSWIHLQYFLQFSHLSGANLPGFSCSLLVRTRISSIFIENIHY